MNLSIEVIIMILAYAVSIGCLYGAISTKIDALTKQVEKHNGVIERQFRLETEFERDKAQLKGEFENLKERMDIYHHE